VAKDPLTNDHLATGHKPYFMWENQVLPEARGI
jgi:hypothetical protein